MKMDAGYGSKSIATPSASSFVVVLSPDYERPKRAVTGRAAASPFHFREFSYNLPSKKSSLTPHPRHGP
jgi:hypothetical protein